MITEKEIFYNVHRKMCIFNNNTQIYKKNCNLHACHYRQTIYENFMMLFKLLLINYRNLTELERKSLLQSIDMVKEYLQNL